MTTSSSKVSPRRDTNTDTSHGLYPPETLEKAVCSRQEDPVVRDAHLAEEHADAEQRRWKERVRFIITIALMLIISGGCVWILFDPNYSADDRKWAMGLIGLIAGRIMANLDGKETK